MTPAKPLVPRLVVAANYNVDGAPMKTATAFDVTKLEDAVRCADDMRLSINCERDDAFAVPVAGCDCCACEAARAYDAARGKVKP